MAVITICYRHGARLDEAYYLATHAPIVARVWGALGMQRAEVRKVTAALDGSAPPYQLIFSVYFPSAAAFQAALQHPSTAEILNDIPNYYDGGTPDIFLGEVLA
jgi:uncharacterized protein (TIGR02118 family)